MKRILVFSLTSAALFLTHLSNAHACRCAWYPVEEQIQMTDVILGGEVIASSDTEYGNESSVLFNRILYVSNDVGTGARILLRQRVLEEGFIKTFQGSVGPNPTSCPNTNASRAVGSQILYFMNRDENRDFVFKSSDPLGPCSAGYSFVSSDQEASRYHELRQRLGLKDGESVNP
jgi:hypothetical protein